jgi:hypothetical protein
MSHTPASECGESSALSKRITLAIGWGVLAYYWSLINDAPINADTLLGRQGYYYMEAVLNLLSLSCFVLVAWSLLRGRAGAWPKRVALWMAMAYLWSAADDTPAYQIIPRMMRLDDRYQLEAAFHVISLAFFFLMVRDSASPERIKGTGSTLPQHSSGSGKVEPWRYPCPTGLAEHGAFIRGLTAVMAVSHRRVDAKLKLVMGVRHRVNNVVKVSFLLWTTRLKTYIAL